MSNINGAAQAAQRAARRANGEFGNQQHSAPEPLALPDGPTAKQLASDIVAARAERDSALADAERAFPGVSIGNPVNARASVRTATEDYVYEARLHDGGRVTESINGRPYEPNGEHRSLRKAAATSKLVSEHQEKLERLATASRDHSEVHERTIDATFYKVVDSEGNVLERHHSERGAEIGAGRHAGSSVVEPAVSDDAYVAELTDAWDEREHRRRNPGTRIPMRMQHRIDEVVGEDDYAPYVLDGQSADSGEGNWHDVLVVRENGAPLKFTQSPDGEVEVSELEGGGL